MNTATKQLPADIAAFRERHHACEESLEWTLENCASMQDVWDKAPDEWLIWVATREEVLDERTVRLFACYCVRQVWHLLTDDRGRNVVEVAERHANGMATDEELAAALDAAVDAASDAAGSAARAAAWASAWAAARDAALANQAKWLRENAKPCFAR